MAYPRLGASACGFNIEYERELIDIETRKKDVDPSAAKLTLGETLTRRRATGRNEKSSVRITPA
jgi:hypothetical protein